MKNQNKQNQVWIGLAKVKQRNINGILGDAEQAYTNVLALAASKSDFRHRAKQAIEDLELLLLRLESAETLEQRLIKFTVDKNLLKLAKGVQKKGGVAFGVFHSFE